MLTPFEFSVPTKIIFGVGEVKKVGGEAARYGKKALLVTYDEDFVKKVGFFDKVADSCKEAGVELLYHFGVKSNQPPSTPPRPLPFAKRKSRM